MTARSHPLRPERSVRTLGRKAGFWVSAAVVTHALWTSAAPAMSYPLYAAEWGLTSTTITAIFAVYPIVVVAVLIGFGDISDYVGRRATMLAGLAASMVGVLLFAIAPDIVWIFVGRAFMGIGVGLSTSPATAAMVEFSAPGQADRASSVTTAAQSLGLTLALLVGGGLIEYAPYPAHFNFWLLLAVIATIFAAAWFMPRHIAAEAPGRWRFKAPGIPRGLRRTFLTAATAATAAFALGALMLSLGSKIAHDLVGSSNALVNGSALALFAVAAGVVATLTQRLRSDRSMMIGGTATAIGMILLALAASYHALPLFLASGIATGSGYSLLFSGGLGLVNAHAPSHHRAGTISALYLVAYLLQGIAALALGVTATAWGLELATDIGAVVIGGISLLAAALAAFAGPPRRTNGQLGTS